MSFTEKQGKNLINACCGVAEILIQTTNFSCELYRVSIGGHERLLLREFAQALESGATKAQIRSKRLTELKSD
jgi:hypothetical protein